MNDGRFFSENVVSTATVSLRIAGEAAPLGWLNCVIQQQRCGRKYSLVWWAQFCCHWSAVDAGKYHEIAGLNRIFDARWCMGVLHWHHQFLLITNWAHHSTKTLLHGRGAHQTVRRLLLSLVRQNYYYLHQKKKFKCISDHARGQNIQTHIQKSFRLQPFRCR